MLVRLQEDGNGVDANLPFDAGATALCMIDPGIVDVGVALGRMSEMPSDRERVVLGAPSCRLFLDGAAIVKVAKLPFFWVEKVNWLEQITPPPTTGMPVLHNVCNSTGGSL